MPINKNLYTRFAVQRILAATDAQLAEALNAGHQQREIVYFAAKQAGKATEYTVVWSQRGFL